MTLYPKIRNVKRGNIAIKIMAIVSIVIALTCTIVNLCTSTRYLWCLIVMVGIIYSWITVIYSVHRNINIASNVVLQTIAISALTLCIDYILGYQGWAINLAIPIIIIVANVTILVLTIVSVRRYYKYAIYQLILSVLSFIPLIILLAFDGIITRSIFTIIASSIAAFTLVMSLILCGRNIVEELDRRLHMWKKCDIVLPKPKGGIYYGGLKT